MITFVAFEAHQVRLSKGERRIDRPAPAMGRCFCAQRGSSLTCEAESVRLPDKAIIEFHIRTLDNPDAYIPDRHWFHRERIDRFDVGDGLPRYRDLGTDMEPFTQGPVVDVPRI